MPNHHVNLGSCVHLLLRYWLETIFKPQTPVTLICDKVGPKATYPSMLKIFKVLSAAVLELLIGNNIQTLGPYELDHWPNVPTTEIIYRRCTAYLTRIKTLCLCVPKFFFILLIGTRLLCRWTDRHQQTSLPQILPRVYVCVCAVAGGFAGILMQSLLLLTLLHYLFIAFRFMKKTWILLVCLL